MLKPLNPDAIRQPTEPPLPVEAVNNVFKVMHGFYGNLFFSKYASGERDEKTGDDKGLASAREVWGFGLRGFDGATVKTALGRCLERHGEFPPSLPQFVQLCAACKPREAYKPPAPPALTMSPELIAQYREEHLARAQDAAKQIRDAYAPATGLDLLKQAIADAVGAAGGDEAAELLRLDRMLAPREAA